MTRPERSRPQNRTQRPPVVRLPRRPVPLDPETAAALQALADRYAARYGDTPEITRSRRVALLEELAALDTRPVSNRAAWQRRQQDQAIRAARSGLAADARAAA